ncbi:kinesin-like protein KIF19 [Pongo pygmaeus]|uniref:kinesin-like protein KIF19 n=1 Tax=Pongo pygmaeus TaxID=9600 RepID=UPI0023E14402|nr:kinesin-like protein KIF19 [Pongo pygmaeus]
MGPEGEEALCSCPGGDRLQVALRIRPLNDAELEEGAAVIAHKVGDQMVVLMDPGEDPEDMARTHRSRERTFIFDRVFDQHASQEDVYGATIQHLVEGVISGYNVTVFAYGPSDTIKGAGKTHTMLGVDAEPGIYLQTLTDLFQAIEETQDTTDYSVSMSYLQIYNEVIRDLLNPSSEFLDLREDSRGSIQIAGITEVSTSNAHEIMQLLTKGNQQRTQEPTATNKTSSRSHAVLQVTVQQRSRSTDLVEEVHVGRLSMVDLAGSERASQTQNPGRRMKEGAHINRSLLALGNCINALSEKGGTQAQYVNFRDGKLTRLLKDALGGNSRTVMIAHISPASTCFEESRTTLLYAYRAKNIKTSVRHGRLDFRFLIPKLSHDTEEDSHLQMNKIRAQLIGAFKEQMEMRRSLVELENTNIELHMDVSRHLLTIADWEREKTQRRTHRDRGELEKDEEPAEADADGDEDEASGPHEVALAKEEVNLLLAEQWKTAALKARLEQRLVHAKRKASQMERLLPRRVTSEDQREVLRLLCRAHELEVENTELQADNLCRKNLLCQKDFVIQRYHQHRLLCQQLIQEQRRLIQDSGLLVLEPLEKRFRLYSQELGEGTLTHLLLLHSLMSSSLRDGSVLNLSPAPEESRRDQPDDRKDLPWGAQFELPPVLLERDRVMDVSISATWGHGRAGEKLPEGGDSPSATSSMLLVAAGIPGSWLHRSNVCPCYHKPSALSVKSLVSKLYPLGLKPSTSRLAGEAGGPALSAQALQEMAKGTKSIALIAATRRSKAHDREGSSGCSSRHLLEETALDSRDPKSSTTPDPSLADRRWPHAGPCRDRSMERKARKKQSPSLPGSVQPAREKLLSPRREHLVESQPPPALLQPSKSSGRSFVPAVPAASKIKPSLSFHADSWVSVLLEGCPPTCTKGSTEVEKIYGAI